ncbi:MAG: dephospho-CoA kinase [Desulfovibrio sp.]|jgi:23S rRNA pseudouridine1911/1915/1917 synthase|nr:dephospho-CoA kinase [Desulfovibrio sp.]
MRDSDARLFTVAPSQAGDRLDRYLADRMAEFGLSRERIKRGILEGRVRVNGLAAEAPRRILREADLVEIRLAAPATRLVPEAGELDILQQDSFLVLLNKPAGLAVHPGAGLSTGTLAHRLAAHFPELAALEGFRPGIVHRLDKGTSGLLLAALTEKSRLALTALFAGRKVCKEYLALARGVPSPAQGTIDAPLGRHPRARGKRAVLSEAGGGKPARSAWRTLYADPEGRFSLLAVRIFTGRTHQIRVHLAHLGHPVLGDPLYAPPDKADPAPRQMLHAWKLALDHPCTGRRICAVCPPPEDFPETARALGTRLLRVVITGSPGCGKSTLSRLLAGTGAPLFSADAEIAALYAQGGAGWLFLRARYGDRFVPDQDSPVDKQTLGQAMRESPALRREMESLLHPLARAAMEDFWRAQEALNVPLALAEVPLYLEAGFSRGDTPSRTASDEALAALLNASPHRPLLLGVSCPFAVRAERLHSGRGWSAEVINSMESWQWPEERKLAACDLVADNSGGKAGLEAEAKRLAVRLAALRDLRGALLAETIRERCREPALRKS